ncbi:MAG: DUF2961 domain-containing protein [Eubacteriales bacterium]
MKKILSVFLAATMIGAAFSGVAATSSEGFCTNLSNIRIINGRWQEESGGLHAVGDGDCFAISDTEASDFVYEAKTKINGNGAVSLVFRSNDDGSQAYVANVDLNRGDARLFKFPAVGTFEFGSYEVDRSVKEYTLRVEAVQNSIRFYVNGNLAVSATDESYRTGKLGLLIWSNDAVFQDVYYQTVSENDRPHLTALSIQDRPDALWFDASLLAFHGRLPNSADRVELVVGAENAASVSVCAEYEGETVVPETSIVSGEPVPIPLGVGVTTVTFQLTGTYTINYTVSLRRCEPISGDLNDDGIVDESDLAVLDDLLSGSISEEAKRRAADLNGDGKIDTEDRKMLDEKIKENSDAAYLSYTDVVQMMTDLRGLADPVLEGENAAESTSYDRRSCYDEATDKYIQWDANDDWGTSFERTEDGGVILADLEGPGAIVRLWSAEPKSGHVKIYIDGSAVPAIDMPFSDYFGSAFPFCLSEICYDASGGKDCYLPITYNQSCKVVAYGDWGRYFHVGYRTFPDGTTVESFSLPLSAEAQKALVGTDRLFAGTYDPTGRDDSVSTVSREVTVPAHGSAVLFETSDSGAIVRITVKCEDLQGIGDDWKALSELAISACWDGEETPSVWTTLGGFFGSICGLNEYSSLPMGVTGDGTLYCNWFMPYSDGAKWVLQNDSDRDRKISYSISTQHLTKTEADGLLRFHAKWYRLADPDKTSDRWPDAEFLGVQGSGRFVGTSLHVYKAIGTGDPAYNADWWWGEGDEKFFVDHEKFPSWFGTGSEDYFGYAWGCWKTFDYAYHAQPFTNGGMFGIGNRLNNRFHIMDSVPFTQSFSACLEKYHRDGYAYMVVTDFWYMEKGRADGYDPVTLEERTEYYQLPYPESAVFYEGEELKILDATGMQKAETQEMSVFGRNWSGGSQLIFKASQYASVRFYINVPKTSKYRISANFTKAGDFGVAEHFIDGSPLGDPIDLYNNGVIRSDLMTIADEIELTAGLHIIEVRMNDKNPASSGYFYGLDCLELTDVGVSGSDADGDDGTPDAAVTDAETSGHPDPVDPDLIGESDDGIPQDNDDRSVNSSLSLAIALACAAVLGIGVGIAFLVKKRKK